jgi:hypothetical protein
VSPGDADLATLAVGGSGRSAHVQHGALGGREWSARSKKNIRVLSVRYAVGVLGVHPKGSMRAFALDIDARLG